MKGRFHDLLMESVIIQGLVTLILVATVSYMFVVGMDVPDTLTSIIYVIIGFYFGSKTQQTIVRGQRKE